MSVGIIARPHVPAQSSAQQKFTGYYRMARGWLDHELFENDVYCRRAAWEWLIAQAAFRRKTITIRGNVIVLERGQFCYALSYIAEAWGWTVARVRRFLAQLTKRHMIGITHSTGQRTARCVVTLCNYDQYQVGDGAGGTAGNTPARAQSAQIRKRQEIKKGEGSPPEVPPAIFAIDPVEEESAAPPGQPPLDEDDVTRPVLHRPAPTPDAVEEMPAAAAGDAGSPPEAGAEFAAWWAVWPHKVDQHRAAAAFAVAREQAALAELVAGAERYAETLDQPRPPFRMNPGNWLRDQRWRDGPFLAPQTNQRWTVIAETGSAYVDQHYLVTSRPRRQSASEAITAAVRDVCLARGGQDIWRNYAEIGSGMAGAAGQ